MRLLLDQNLSYRLCRLLAAKFPGSVQVRLLGLDKAEDREVWRYAEANELTLVSHDSDFAELAALYGPPPKVIWLRCGNLPTTEIADILLGQADTIAAFLAQPDEACLQIYDRRP